MTNIKLSPKHGINPSINLCFYCGSETGVLLLGKLKGDMEAPRFMSLNTEPCDKCKELMKVGILLIGIDVNKTDDMNNPYRSGKMVVVKDNWVNKNVKDDDLKAKILRLRFTFIDSKIIEGVKNPTQH